MKTTIPTTLRGAAFILAASLAASLAAQTTDTSATSTATGTTMTDNSKLSHHDRSFFEKAAKAGAKEVAVSQAVMGSLVNPSVKDFANTMVTDHTAANNELMALAARKGVAIPMEDTAKLTSKWSEKSGNVDKKYVHEMVEDHEDAVKLFEKASKSEDADIAAFAQKTLPTLQHHLGMAQDLKKSL